MPVSVVLIPCDNGLLVIRRNIEPQKGKLALPGGFIETGESWQSAGAREVREECGISIDPSTIREFMVKSTPDNRSILLFGLAEPFPKEAIHFQQNSEATELQIIYQVEELAFPLHTLAIQKFFHQSKYL
jgi:ADP-ribose pyrophosphatase YjhB (NUDIX family)